MHQEQGVENQVRLLLGPYLGEEELLANVRALQRPPLLTHLRVNTIVTQPQIVLGTLKTLLPKFKITSLPEDPTIIEIAPSGPNLVYPAERQVIVSTECAQAVLRGAHVFAAGLLAIQDNVLFQERVSVWADLSGKCTRGMRKEYVGDKIFVGNGLLRKDRDEIFKSDTPPKGIAVEMTEMEWILPSFDGLPLDMLRAQNLPSILTSIILDPQPNHCIIDMCASPGGKTSHIAALINNTGILIAIDKSPKKIQVLRQTLQILKVTSAYPYLADSTRLVADDGVEPAILVKSHSSSWSHFTRLAPQTFDRVLLDPPCSGFGQRPHLVAKEEKNSPNVSNQFANFAGYQRRLFAEAYRLLKIGGILVYSTCTMNPEENEAIVTWALKEFEDLALLPTNSPYGSSGIAHPAFLPSSEARKLARFWPAGVKDTIAFFIAKFTKISRHV